MDKMGLRSERLATFFVVAFIAFPIVLIATSMYQNSSFGILEGFLKDKVLGGETLQNFTTNGLGLEHITHDNPGGTNKKNTASEVLQEKTQNGGTDDAKDKDNIAADLGYKNASLTSSTNDSTPRTGNHDDKDKLLDGLLASGFDEASCISRLHSHLYRKASPHKPSPYLISKLRNYEELHRRCGPNTRAYNITMTNIIHSNNTSVASVCKYIVFSPANGLGNRIISMAATFLYAILTNRVLLVRFGTDMHGLFCEPFLNSTWELPENSPFWNQQHVETYENILEKEKANNISKEDLPSVLFINLMYTPEEPERFFHCDHSQDLLQNVPLLILQSDQYFVPTLFVTPSFSLEIIKMFPERDTMFHHLGHYLFHPSNEAWGLINRFYQAYLAKADERIGLQIRVFHPENTPQEIVMEQVLSCTMKHKLLPELDMKNLVQSYSLENKTLKVVLVTSLYPEYGENLRSMYLNKATVSGELIGVYQPSHEEQQKFDDNMHNMKAWTEIYLLSLSDKLVTSSFSTFGYVAQGLGGLKPWLLNHPYKKKTNNSSSCGQDFSSEPCFHFPPKHECNGKPLKTLASSFPDHMSECMDFHGRGVKLVSDSA